MKDLDEIRWTASPARVATLTFHEAYNYGAVLQAYALQRALMDLGADTILLNYSCPAVSSCNDRPVGFRPMLGWLLRSRVRHLKRSRFERFKSENIRISEPVAKEGLSAFSDACDAIFVGSDQVWNPIITGGDATYFLDFVDDVSKRKTYAASLGTDAWDLNFEPKGARLASCFSSLSLRERQGAEYLSGLLGTETRVDCDPVLLLSDDQWREVLTRPKIDGDYMLVYTLSYVESDCLAWARVLAQERGLRLVVIHDERLPIPGVVNVRDAGPAEFLGWIEGASLVTTHSFHGCCFSILFERDFAWYRSSETSEAHLKVKGRLENLLAMFGLEGRAVLPGGDWPGAIDYASVRPRLEAARSSSLSYLVNCVGGVEGQEPGDVA